MVEQLPESGEGGVANIPGVRIVGDLTGIPLLKFSSKTGSEAVHAILAEPDFQDHGKKVSPDRGDELLHLAIIGGGVSGVSAAIEAKKAGLNFKIFEATQPFLDCGQFSESETDLRLSNRFEVGRRAPVHQGCKGSLARGNGGATQGRRD